VRLVILTLPGMRAFEVSSIMEVFAGHPDAPALSGGSIRVVSPQGGTVDIGHGISIDTDPLHGISPAETVIVPGFDSVPDLIRRIDGGEIDDLLEILRLAHAKGAQIASVCTGAFILAAAGLLDGVRATSHWMTTGLLRERFPRVILEPNVLYTHDRKRRLWTSAGVTASIDLCLALLAAEKGATTAATAARGMVIPAARHGGQAQYVPPRFGDHELPGGEFSALHAAVRADLARPWPIAELARICVMTPRTLQRRFRRASGMTPREWIVNERLTVAREMLETSTLPIEEVAQRAGFGDADLLRKHFTRRLGTTPSRYRDTFRVPVESRG